ncbi:MAG TPA: ABC transporter substrate-binding protein [Ruminiclostridium sp.]
MKRTSAKSVISLVMVVTMMLTALVGCGTSKDSTATSVASTSTASTQTVVPEEKQEIRLMTAWTAGSAAYNAIEALLKTYKTDKPNITIVHDALPSADLRTKLTVEMAAGTPPDVSWCVLSYANEFIKDNKIIDWAPVFADPKHPEFKKWFSEVSLNFASTPDGKIMMVPQEGSIDGLFYNTEMFTKNGWTPPTTFDELLALVPLIKAKGISPLVTGGKDGRFAWLASALLARSAGLDNFNALCKGESMKSWNDPKFGFVGAMEKFSALVKSGAYPKGVLGMSASEADQMFARGEAAMYYEGAWKPGNFQKAGGDAFLAKVARVNFPVMTDSPNGDAKVNVGGNIIGFFVASGLTPSKTEACINLVKDVCSPEFNVPIMENGGFVYAGNADYDKTKVSAVLNQCIEAYRTATSYIPSMDAIAPPSVDLAIKQTAMPGILTGEFDVAKAVAEVQKAAEDYSAAK